MACSFLFAYGTLQPGLAPEPMAALVGRLQAVGEGCVRGRLYDLGEYPGAVLEESGAEIRGTVYRLPEGDSLLPALDAYEGFEPDCFEGSLFIRIKHDVYLADNGSLRCWMYVYNGRVQGLPIISLWRG